MRTMRGPGLLDTGPVSEGVMAVRDGIVNVFVLVAPGGLVCVDTGWRPARIVEGFDTLGLNVRDVTAVLLTHLHWDHAGCLSLFAHADVFVGDDETAPARMRRSIPTRNWKRVKGNQTFAISGLTCRVIDTPGHTVGSVSYVVDDALLFSGDTLRLKHGKVRPFPAWRNRDRRALAHSVRALAGLEGLACVFTPHTGICTDPDDAFSPWRGAADARRPSADATT